MQELIDKCLNLIIQDDVDDVLLAFSDVYIWYVRHNFSHEEYKGRNILKIFLDNIASTLIQKKRVRRIISQEEIKSRNFRDSKVVARTVHDYLDSLDAMDGIVLLGQLIGTYSVVVPEPLFRVANSFRGIHQTPDIPPIDDNLPMSDEMICFCWQYFWFYTWLGY